MLIVDIKINTNEIGRLEIRRLNDIFQYELIKKVLPCVYTVKYIKEDVEYKFTLKHNYHDKAETLIIKALEKVKELEKEGY